MFVHAVWFKILSVYCKVLLKHNSDADFFHLKQQVIPQILHVLYCPVHLQMSKEKFTHF